MREQMVTVSLDGLPCVLPHEAGLANSYWCPLGGAVGRAWVLMLWRDLEQVYNTESPFHELVFACTEKSGNRQETTQRVVFPSLLLVKGQRLTPGPCAAGDSLYLVELADKRLLVDQFSDTGNLGMNLRSYANASTYLTGTSGYSWSSAVEEIWNEMSDLLGSYPGLPT